MRGDGAVSGRPTRTWSDLYTTGYIVVMGVLTVGATLYLIGHSTLPDLLRTARSGGHSVAVVEVGALAIAVAGWLGAWRFAGPLAGAGATLRWSVSTRDPDAWQRLQRRRMALVAIAFTAVGCGISVMTVHAIGGPSALAGCIVSAALLLAWWVVLACQRTDVDEWISAAASGLCALGLGLLAAAAWGTIAAVCAALVVVGFAVVAARDPRARSRPVPEIVPQWQLVAAAHRRWAVRAGVTLLDADVVQAVRYSEQKRDRRSMPDFLFRVRYPGNLVVVSALRGGRSLIPGLAAGAVVVMAANQLFGAGIAVAGAIILEHVATVVLLGTAKRWLTAPALGRTWADGGMRPVLALSLPSLLAGWIVIAVLGGVIGLPWPVWIVTILHPALVIVRRLQVVRQGDRMYLLSTPMGPLPVQAVQRAVAGYEILVVVLVLAAYLA